MPGWREGNSMPTKTAILLTRAAASLGAGTSFAQTARPGANLPNVGYGDDLRQNLIQELLRKLRRFGVTFGTGLAA